MSKTKLKVAGCSQITEKIADSQQASNEMVDLTLRQSRRWLIDISSITKIIDEEIITEMMEENPEVMNLIMQRLNSENQENGAKRNRIE